MTKKQQSAFIVIVTCSNFVIGEPRAAVVVTGLGENKPSLRTA